MKLKLEWATFGELRAGSHGLLNTSLPTSELQSLETLAARTDRPIGSIPDGKMEAFTSGFREDRWYVLMRTREDQTTERGGFVRSYCLLLPIEFIGEVENLHRLMTLLPPLDGAFMPSRTWEELLPREIEIDQMLQADVHIGTSSAWQLGMIARLLSSNHPAVWIEGQRDFENTLMGVWAHLPKTMRPHFRFGHSYMPSDNSVLTPHLVSAPKSTAPRWEKGVIHALQRSPQSAAEALLLGTAEGNRLNQFLKYLPEVERFSDLVMIGDYIAALEQFEAGDQTAAVSAARILVKIAPDANRAVPQKDKLIPALISAITRGTKLEIQRFANLPISPFGEATNELQSVLSTWGYQHFESSPEIDAAFVSRVFDDKYQEWWRTALHQAFHRLASKLSDNFARKLWAWLDGVPGLLNDLQTHFPHNVDLRLFKTAPLEVNARQSLVLLEFVKTFQDQRGHCLPRLEVLALLKTDIGIEQILKHCITYNDQARLEGLDALTHLIGDQAFVLAAVSQQHDQILVLAGQLCARQPKILREFDPTSLTWQRIWLISIQQSPATVSAVQNPQEVVFAILNQYLDQAEVNTELLLALSNSTYANLVAYLRRNELWTRLPPTVSVGFLDATSNGVFACWASGIAVELEARLDRHLFQGDRFLRAIANHPHDAAKIVTQALRFSHHLHVNEVAAIAIVEVLSRERLEIEKKNLIEDFATSVRQQGWTQVARASYKGYCDVRTKTLSTLCEHTLEKLSLMEKIVALFELNRPYPHEDFYKALREELCTSYPRGPRSEGFWHDVGGQEKYLTTGGSVNDQWNNALSEVRNGRVRLAKVLTVAIERNPNNDHLRTLERLSHRL
jgi:GTPase-associated protein 1, N-terminal domain type 1/Effector-associated domain 1